MSTRLVAMIGVITASACAAPSETPESDTTGSTAAASAEIDQLHQEWAGAIRAGDVDRALDMLTSDYLLWPAGGEPIQGAEAVRPLFTAAMAAYVIEPRLESEERLISGDLAVERAWDIQTVTPKAGGDPQTQQQRVMLVLRRVDGQWKYARGMTQPGPPDPEG